MSSTKRTYQEALDTCAADGASLPKILSAEDALAVKHYVNKNNFDNAWTSLLKLNSTIQCKDNTCDGLVEWPGGQTFAFDASVHTAVDGTKVNNSCFGFRKDKDKLDDNLCTDKRDVICQFTPITVPSDYELRNGKYYKVSKFMCTSFLQ